jgi:hypothetical protein
MLNVINKNEWSESDRALLRERAAELDLTEDQTVERLAKFALYNSAAALASRKNVASSNPQQQLKRA